MTSTEDCFPRGGFKPTPNTDQGVKKPQRQENLFGNIQLGKKSKSKKKRQNNQDEVEATSVPDFINKTDNLTAVSADTLSYKKIHDGMIVLACIRQFHVMTIDVELPGRCFAEIFVQNISSAYTKLVSDAVTADGTELPTLSKMFKIGTFIPVKITEINNDSDNLRIFASCNPVDINQHYKHADFTKNMLVWGTIKEKSDHGYLIDLGVKNCRAHIPFDAIDEDHDTELTVGAVLYMTITKSVTNNNVTTLTLSALRSAFDKTVESMGTSLDKVIPGMQVEFLIQKSLKDGLQGQYFDECTGFINDLYLQKPFESNKKYKEFTTLKARLMYVHPVSKLGYFTLKPLHDDYPDTKLNIGDWISSKVISRVGSGVVVKLDGGFKGYITGKRLLNSIKTTEKERDDLSTLIANKFPAGTTKHCTVLDYNHTERLYICTFEHITEFINIKQLSIAQTVKGTIKSINDHGIVMRVGKLEAFAPKDNLSNVRYSETIRKQFKIGQEVTAKVWNISIEKQSIILTLKPELLSSNIHLCSYKDWTISQLYPGVVISTIKNGVLLKFYGGIQGWLPARNIPQLGKKDARNEFYAGQILKVRVLKVEGEKMTCTMNLPPKKRIKVGTVVSKPIVTQVTNEGLIVTINDTEAFVPKEQLAIEGLGKLLMSTYKVNEVLDEDLICLMDRTPPILSVRECFVQKRDDLKIPALQDLKVNTVMRAMYQDKRTICVPLKLHHCLFKVEDKVLNHLDRYESLCAKVMNVKQNGKKIEWSVDLEKVFSFSHLETFKYLDQYLDDIERLRARYLQTGNSMVDLEIGATVDCVVKQVDPKRGCIVTILPMNCQGLVSMNQCPDKISVGKKLKGKVLWVNYELKYAAIALCPKVIKKINETQDQVIDLDALNQIHNNVVLEVVHSNRNLAVGVLRKKYNQQLVYLPVKLHENDFAPQINYYDALIGQEIKVKLTKMKSGRLFAVTTEMFQAMGNNRRQCGKMLIIRNSTVMEQLNEKKQKVKKPKVEIKEEDEGIESSEDIKSEVESIDDINDDNVNVNNSDDDMNGNSDVEDEDDEMEVVVPKTVKLNKKQKRKLQELEESKNLKKKKINDEVKIDATETPAKVILPGMSSFFEDDVAQEIKQESDDEDQSTVQKKKLTPAERLQKAKDEEARLRKIETELADDSVMPQNAEQFDRALLGNPDDSELWTRYIAFHAQSTEFEKARTVARRAIERISFTALQDRLNVWLAYLNLENMYGTKDSFNSVFEEAARCNDTMTIYLETIKMMSEMSKFVEMEEKIKKARGKFKQELQMWLEIGKVYYKCGKFTEARKFKDNALLTLIDKKSHLQLIVQYAIMEFAHGERTQGEALFETILQADPKRVDIWCTYVDQLIKKEKIDLARNVLSRAVGQKLPYKKMRTLFKKYHAFETEHGDEKTIEHVTNLLREYTDDQ